jgi:Zn-dependent protease
VGNFTVRGLELAVTMLAALFVGMTAREYARAWMANRLGDPTPRLWGRVSLAAKSWFDPFGSGLLAGLVAVLWTVQALMSPVAYGKPAPIDPSYLRRQPRDVLLVSLAGPVATLALSILAGLPVALAGLPSGLARSLVVVSFSTASLTIFHLLPIPGLDGARMVALTLPPTARETFRNFDRYLPLVVLVVLFFLGGLTTGLLELLAGAICSASTGLDCRLALRV